MRTAALSRWNLVCLASLAVALLCTPPAAAGMKQLELGGEDAGWKVEWHPGFDPTLSIEVIDVDLDGDEVVIRKIATFFDAPSGEGLLHTIPLAFSQTKLDAVSRIRIGEEILTNMTNVPWGGFHMEVAADGDAQFNMVETEASGTSGFDISPFAVRTYGPGGSAPFYTFDALGDGEVENGEVWTPGGDGSLVLDVVVGGPGPFTTFTLKERPLPKLVNQGIAEPASGLLACIGLVMLATLRRWAGT